MKVVAVVPAKGNSTRLPNKNCLFLCGTPLVIITIKKLLKIETIDEVWLDTDSDEIVNLIEYFGLKSFTKFRFFLRDKELADNATDGNKLLSNEFDKIKNVDVLVQVLCTSPFLKAKTIETAINSIVHKGFTSVVTVYEDRYYFWNIENKNPLYDVKNIPNSNTLKVSTIEAMSLYAIDKNEFQLSGQLRIGRNPLLLKIDNSEFIDINTVDDYNFSQEYALGQVVKEQSYRNLLKKRLNSSIISDVLMSLGYTKQLLPKTPFININNKTMFGRCKTMQVRYLKEGENPQDIYKCMNHYDTVTHGDIILINNLLQNKAYFGDLNATLSMKCNVQGVIVYGYTRDCDKTKALDLPIFCSEGYTCADVKNYGTLDFFNQPLNFQNPDGLKTTVYVNDLIFADTDGIVAIPQEVEDIVIEKSLCLALKENSIVHSICSGKQITDIIKEYGFF